MDYGISGTSYDMIWGPLFPIFFPFESPRGPYYDFAEMDADKRRNHPS